VTRPGRSPAPIAAARLSEAAAILATEPGITGAELGRRVGVGTRHGASLLAAVRATVPDLPAPAPEPPSRVVRLPGALVARLERWPGETVQERIAAAVDAAEGTGP
jgi:hypothetical protein